MLPLTYCNKGKSTTYHLRLVDRLGSVIIERLQDALKTYFITFQQNILQTEVI